MLFCFKTWSLIFLLLLVWISQKSNREAKEGAIGIYSNDSITTMLQINTETDFAAKNDVFLDFMDEIGKYSLKVENVNVEIDDIKNLKNES